MKHLFTTILLARPTGKPWLGVLLAALLAFPITAALAQSGNAPANTYAPLTSTTHSNLVVTGSFSNLSNLTDPIIFDNSASSYYVLGGSGSIRVKDNSATGTSVYPAGSYAGFVVGTGDIEVVGDITITTYLGSTKQDEQSGSSLVSLGILSASRGRIGFITTKPFDAIQYSYSAVGLGTKYVYYAEVKRYDEGEELECNEPTALTTPEYPVEVETELSALCLVCAFTNTENVIDNDPNTAATLSTTAAVLASASLTVSDQISTYPANTFAGFDIESNSLLSIGVLNGIQIQLLKDGLAVQTSPANLVLAGVSSQLISDPSRQRIGIVSNTDFDAVKIIFNLPVNVDLGSVQIYGLVMEKLCEATLACNQTYDWSGPEFPTIINTSATGVSGLVDVGGNVANPWNVINGNNTEYATLSTTLGVGGAVTLAVQDPIGTYPIGTTAGFAIDIPSGIIKLNLLDNLTLSTYLDGTLQETFGSSQVLELSLLTNLIGGSPTEPYNIGFVSQKAFDEVRISVNSLASLLNTVRVYSAFIDTRSIVGGGGLICLNPAPDFNVTYPGIATTGDVSTNDISSDPVTYGTAVEDPGNPAGTSLTVNSNGTYSFIAASPGVYSYQIPVCLAGQSSGCATETLQITVLDKNSTANLPVANPDYAYMKGADATPGSVTVDVASNDGVGNIGGSLGTVTIPTPPANGTATIDGNGNLVFTPTAGFYGKATVTYQVCESPSGLCSTADLTVNVLPPAASNMVSASDDYASVPMDSTLTITAADGLVSNDYFTDVAALSVTPQDTTIAGVGTLVLASDGSYTFTPEPGYSGPASFPYTTCAGIDCNDATLYILVTPVPNLTAAQFLSGTQLKADNSNTLNYVVAISNVGSATTNGSLTFTISKFDVASGIELTLSSLGTSTIFGNTYTLNNDDFDVVSTATEMTFTTKSGVNIAGLGVKYIGLTITRTGGTAETVFNTVTITSGTGGGEVESANNAISNPVTKL